MRYKRKYIWFTDRAKLSLDYIQSSTPPHLLAPSRVSASRYSPTPSVLLTVLAAEHRKDNDYVSICKKAIYTQVKATKLYNKKHFIIEAAAGGQTN